MSSYFAKNRNLFVDHEYDTLRGGANQVPDAVASLNEGVF